MKLKLFLRTDVMHKKFVKPILALALVAATTAATVDSAEARGRRFVGGLAAGLIAGGLIGAYSYRPYSYYGYDRSYYYSSGPYCYKGALRCRWHDGYERCWRPTICE